VGFRLTAIYFYLQLFCNETVSNAANTLVYTTRQDYLHAVP